LSAEGCLSHEAGDWCTCEPVGGTCRGVAATCDSETSILACFDGQLISTECADVCAGMDPPWGSEGCDEAGWVAECSCTLAGTACDRDASPRCDSFDMLAICVDGAWVLDACVDGCGEGEFG
jgi:hypothetical protein